MGVWLGAMVAGARGHRRHVAIPLMVGTHRHAWMLGRAVHRATVHGHAVGVHGAGAYRAARISSTSLRLHWEH